MLAMSLGSIYVNLRELAAYARGKIGHQLVILFGTVLLVDESPVLGSKLTLLASGYGSIKA